MKKKRSRHFGLMSLFVTILFLTVVLNSALTVAAMFFLVKSGLLDMGDTLEQNLGVFVLLTAQINIPIGLAISVVAVKFPLKPVRELIDGMDTLAAGDFSIRMNAGAIMKRYPDFVEVSKSFNKLAGQLENTEMLRSDFINNFSHEFKTPIVSIAGFAKLLQRGNLSQTQQREYLEIIEEESIRLSYMATNVLNLSKVENQTILSDVAEFNLSEQLRSCILMLEHKWESKNLDLQPEFSEHMIRGNEELLKEVWINLLDNAVKFTPEGQTVCVGIEENVQTLEVSILNTGSEIAPEKQALIFNKFYQADESHAAQGNGVGLAVVWRIVQLHGGEVKVKSGDNVTEFIVTLPE